MTCKPRSEADEDEFSSIDQVAQRFGVNRRTIRDWVGAGVLPAWRVGPRLLRVRRADVDALLKRVDVGPTAGADQ